MFNNYSNQRRFFRALNRSDRFLLVMLLRVIWFLTIIYVELFHFGLIIRSCQWPILFNNNNNNSELSSDQFRILILADPQLPSIPYSYPDRNYLSQLLSVEIIYQFIRKSWSLTLSSTRPDAIVFLGDLMDGGVTTSDPEKFKSYFDRFQNTFKLSDQIVKNISSGNSTRLLFIAGNHDLGLYPHTSESTSDLARQRFIKHWPPGKLNGIAQWANHSIIWIDSMRMIEESSHKSQDAIGLREGGVTDFLKKLSGPNMMLPKVLFSHVPLWREEGTSCGPLRESKRSIRQGSGRNYQNEIPEDSTQMILETIQPEIVFSGDDHDYCEIEHQIPSSSLAHPSPLLIPEVSVKSFSMGMGVHSPGYHLLSLSNPSRFARAPDERTIAHRACLLPDQIRLYTHIYSPLYLLTLMILVGPRMIEKISRFGSRTRRQQAKTNGLPIHHRPRIGHRKSLSRTLMFHKAPNGSGLSSDSSSSDEQGRSDEEESGRMKSNRSMLLASRNRRSLSLGIGVGNSNLSNEQQHHHHHHHHQHHHQQQQHTFDSLNQQQQNQFSNPRTISTDYLRIGSVLNNSQADHSGKSTLNLNQRNLGRIGSHEDGYRRYEEDERRSDEQSGMVTKLMVRFPWPKRESLKRFLSRFKVFDGSYSMGERYGKSDYQSVSSSNRRMRMRSSKSERSVWRELWDVSWVILGCYFGIWIWFIYN